MAEDYRGLMARSIDSEIPSPAWLRELQDDGGAVLDGVTEAFGLPAILR